MFLFPAINRWAILKQPLRGVVGEKLHRDNPLPTRHLTQLACSHPSMFYRSPQMFGDLLELLFHALGRGGFQVQA